MSLAPRAARFSRWWSHIFSRPNDCAKPRSSGATKASPSLVGAPLSRRFAKGWWAGLRGTAVTRLALRSENTAAPSFSRCGQTGHRSAAGRYLNLLFKQLLFLHAFRRFDLEPEKMRRRNLITLVLDEGQKTTLVSEDGFSDHATVDELREADVSLISATQTPLSLYAAFETERKADAFMANLRTHIHFRAADEKGAKIISDKMGGREIRKYSGGVSSGRTSRNWQPADEPWFKPIDVLALADGKALIKHPRRRGLPLLRRLAFTAFTLRNEPAME